MPLYNDPLDDLIGDLERMIPVAAPIVVRPRLEELQLVLCAILESTPAEQERLDKDPAFQQLQARVFAELEAAIGHRRA
jgi:hypothetical protein